jgi:AcrR family transcriptional regulator
MRTAPALPTLNGLDPATRARIDNAVLQVFCDREFHRVGLIDIARGANVSLQTLYKYYGSKEALLFCGLDAQLGQLGARMLDHLQGLGECKERLRKLFWVTLDFFEQNPKVMHLITTAVYLGGWQPSDSCHQRKLRETVIGVLDEGRLGGTLNREVGDDLQLDFIVGVVQRLIQGHIQRGQQEPLAVQANALFEMLWRAIAAQPA